MENVARTGKEPKGVLYVLDVMDGARGFLMMKKFCPEAAITQRWNFTEVRAFSVFIRNLW